MKKKWLAVLSFVLLVVLCAFVGKNFVLARDNTGKPDGAVIISDNDSGSTSSGCNHTYNTCTGATWRYYTWPNGATSVTIPGSATNANYKTVTISGREAEICAKAGGYYRYAFVNRDTGEQYGTMTLAAHNSTTMRTSMLEGPGGVRGGTHYRGPNEGGDDWGTVKAAYDDARARYPDVVPANGFEWGSGLRVFCASKGDTPPPQLDVGECGTKSGTTTTIVTKVRNNSLGGGYSDTAWVGVGQQADWLHCYYPGVQKLASKAVSTIDKPGTWTCNTMLPHTVNYNADGIPQYWYTDFFDNTFKVATSYYTFSNHNLSGVTTWQNQLTFSRNFGSNPAGKSYTIGDSSMKIEHNYHSVDNSNVSGVLTETATTGTPTTASTNTTPVQGIEWKCSYEWRWESAEGVKPEGCGQETVCGGHWEDYYTDRCKKVSCGGNPYQCICYEYYKDKKWVDDMCSPGDPDYPQGMYCQTNWVLHSDTRVATFWNGTEYVTWSTNAPNTASSSADVKVPINYAITGNISIAGTNLYAGETVGVNNGTLLNTAKWNNATRNAYATNSGQVSYKLISYVSGQDESKTTLDNNLCNGKPYCSTSGTQSVSSIGANSSRAVLANQFGTLHIPDVKAGNYFCVALAYYPTNSGSDTNLGNWNGNGQWGASSVSCQIIRKKPTMQVWGASVYSAGKITTSTSTKNNLNGTGYVQSGTVSSANIFGSWAEQAVVSLGQVQGLASGAAISKGIVASPSGVYCKYFVPLSFANNFGDSTGCPGGQASGSMANNVSNIIADREGLVNKVAPMTGVSQVSSTNNIDISRPASYQEVNSQNGRKVRVTYSANSLSLAGANLTKGITHVVRSNSTITINSDITYDNDGYTEMGQVPKLIIFANGNINIKCNVSRIDAVLIANGNVNTCSDSSDVDSEKNSKQLKINGTVITNRLIAKRTYGNATGANSAVPAEIINYDSSIILWSSVETDTSGTDTVNVTYQHELAPRY